MDLRKLDHIPSVKLVMTPFPYYVEVSDPVLRVEELMDEHGIRHVPVQEHGRLVGIVTHRDLRRLVHPALPRKQKERIRVRQVCVFDPYVVDVDRPLDEVAAEMAERHLGSVLVVKDEKLVGIFSVTDACRVIAELLRAYFGTEGPDEVA
jgi:acetoin utilization protein AcuB